MSVKTMWFTRAESLGQNSGCMPDHCPVQARADYSIDTVVRKPLVHLMTGVQGEQSLQEHHSPDFTGTDPEQSVSPGEKPDVSGFLSFQVHGACIIPCFDSQLENIPCSWIRGIGR